MDDAQADGECGEGQFFQGEGGFRVEMEGVVEEGVGSQGHGEGEERV